MRISPAVLVLQALALAAAGAELATEEWVQETISNEIELRTINLDAQPIELSIEDALRGVRFTNQYGEEQNTAIEIGTNAVAKVQQADIAAAPSNAVVRSLGVAVGGNATVANEANPLKIQGVAVGYNATVSAINGVAIGGGMQHPGETATTGNATVAAGECAIALGYNAKSVATNAVQIGSGVNTTANSLKFQNVPIVQDGKLAFDDTTTTNKAVQAALDEVIARSYATGNYTTNTDSTGTYKQIAFTWEQGDDTPQWRVRKYDTDDVPVELGDMQIYTCQSVDNLLAGYKPLQTAKTSPLASGTAWAFIDTIEQDTNGVISATRKTVSTATTSAPGVVQLSTSTNDTSQVKAATPGAVRQVAITANAALAAALDAKINTVFDQKAFGSFVSNVIVRVECDYNGEDVSFEFEMVFVDYGEVGWENANYNGNMWITMKENDYGDEPAIDVTCNYFTLNADTEKPFDVLRRCQVASGNCVFTQDGPWDVRLCSGTTWFKITIELDVISRGILNDKSEYQVVDYNDILSRLDALEARIEALESN